MGNRVVSCELANVTIDPEPSCSVVEVMGLPLWAVDTEGLIHLLVDRASRGVPSRVCYLNAHSWNLSRRDPTFRELLATADVLYADGMSVVWASRLLGGDLPARLSSADYVEDFALACAARGVSLYLLGGAEDVANRAAERLTEHVPGLHVAGTHHGYFDVDEADEVVDRINQASPDLLMVGMGSPRQERFSADNRSKLDVPVIWSVGALFDYLADVEWRAPRWICQTGLEWAFRLAVDPRGKLGRYLVGNPVFVGSVVKARVLQSLRNGSGRPIEVGVG